MTTCSSNLAWKIPWTEESGKFLEQRSLVACGPWGHKELAMTEHTTDVVVVVQSPSRVRLFAIPWTAAHQASLSLTIS